MAVETKSAGKTSPREVLERAKAEGVEVVDVRFVDLPGTWQHFSLPLGELEVDSFKEGLGFDGSSIRGFQSIDESDMLLIPDPDSATIDPVLSHKTLFLICDVVDPITREPYSRDARFIAHECSRCGRSRPANCVQAQDVSDESKPAYGRTRNRIQPQPRNGTAVRGAVSKAGGHDFAAVVRFPGWTGVVRANFAVIARVGVKRGVGSHEDPTSAVPPIDLHPLRIHMSAKSVTHRHIQAVALRRRQIGLAVFAEKRSACKKHKRQKDDVDRADQAVRPDRMIIDK